MDVTMATDPSRTRAESGLLSQTVVVIGGSSGIGLETGRQARAAGAQVVLTARTAGRVDSVARELQARYTAAFDATDLGRLEQFFTDLPGPIVHVMLSAGSPSYAPLSSMDLAEARRASDQRLSVTLGVALFYPWQSTSRRLPALRRRHRRAAPWGRHGDRVNAYRRPSHARREPGARTGPD